MHGTYCRLGVHVYASNLTVIRELRKKLRPEFLRERSQRDRRHSLYRDILKIHANEQSLVREFRL